MSMEDDIDIIFFRKAQAVPAEKTVEVDTPKKYEGLIRLLGFKIWNLAAAGDHIGFIIHAKNKIIYNEILSDRVQKSGDNQNHNSYIPFVDQYDTVNHYYGLCLSPPALGLPMQDPRFFLRNTHTAALTISYELWYQIIPGRV